jgi:hypothetical protein
VKKYIKYDVCQPIVVGIEHNNAIIKYHFHNDKAYQKEYQHIDSLIHNYGVYDAYDDDSAVSVQS